MNIILFVKLQLHFVLWHSLLLQFCAVLSNEMPIFLRSASIWGPG